MSPRARRVTRAYLDQVIREELAKMLEASPADVAQIADSAPMPPEEGYEYVEVPFHVQCLDCDEQFPDRPSYIEHDLAAHQDARIAEVEARLRERKGRA